MTKSGVELFVLAVERYKKEALEAKEKGNKEALKEARWKVRYFKDKIRKKKAGKNETL